MDKLKVSIGIPAYNEEANIVPLLKALLAQDFEEVDLVEIIVVSDGSSDKTVVLANSLNDSRIHVIDSKERKGQAERQNEILNIFTGDVLVLLNADVLPENKKFIQNIVAPLQISGVGLTSCKHVPVASKTFVGKVLGFSVKLKDAMVEPINDGRNIYMCHGGARAFSKEYAKKLHWPAAVGEDAYSYLRCKELGYEFRYLSNTILLYGVPQNLKDHFKQSVRFRNSQKILRSEFSGEDIKAEYAIPISLFIFTLFHFLITQPILTVCYLMFQIIGLLNPYRVSNSATWEPSTTSKRLIQ